MLMFPETAPVESNTLAAIEPEEAEYAPTGGASVVTSFTVFVPAMPGQVTSSFTCMIWPVVEPGLSHVLVDELWPTNCTFCVTVYCTPLTTCPGPLNTV